LVGVAEVTVLSDSLVWFFLPSQDFLVDSSTKETKTSEFDMITIKGVNMLRNLVVAEDDDCPTRFCNLQYWGSASAGMTEKHCIYFTRFFSGTRGSTCSGLSMLSDCIFEVLVTPYTM